MSKFDPFGSEVVMHQIPDSSGRPVLEVDGVLFHVAALRDVVPDGPSGILINHLWLKDNPLLRAVVRDGLTFRFFAFDPVPGLAVNPHRVGWEAQVDLYAEWTTRATEVRSVLETTIDAKENPLEVSEADPPEVREIAHQLLLKGFECCCEFVDILRRKFAQYWLVRPDPSIGWHYVLYHSRERAHWYSIIAGDDFSVGPNNSDLSAGKEWGSRITLKIIESQDASELNLAQPEPPYSFPEEMISTALVELSKGRKRSAIIHAVIALESASKRALRSLVAERLAGLDQASLLEAISKEVRTGTLAQLVYRELGIQSPTIDWPKLDSLFNTRNTIIHKDQRRLPEFDILKKQFLQAFEYVRGVENALRRVQE